MIYLVDGEECKKHGYVSTSQLCSELLMCPTRGWGGGEYSYLLVISGTVCATMNGGVFEHFVWDGVCMWTSGRSGLEYGVTYRVTNRCYEEFVLDLYFWCPEISKVTSLPRLSSNSWTVILVINFWKSKSGNTIHEISLK